MVRIREAVSKKIKNNKIQQQEKVQKHCSVCGSTKNEVYKDFGKFTYNRCKNCGGVFVHPLQAQDFYLGTETYLHDADLYTSRIDAHGQRWMAEQFDRMYREVTGNDTISRSVLEIGAGVGFLGLVMHSRGWNVKGLETSKAAVDFGKKIYKTQLDHSTIESYAVSDPYDAFVMVEVLEHFIDPLAAIEAIKKHAKEGAVLFGTTPNTDSKHWKISEQNIYVPEDHIFLFNEKSIKKLAEKAGIKDFRVEYFGSGEKHDSNLMYCGIISPKTP